MNIPLFDLEAWVRDRQKPAKNFVPHRLDHARDIVTARTYVAHFIANLNTGDDPWCGQRYIPLSTHRKGIAEEVARLLTEHVAPARAHEMLQGDEPAWYVEVDDPFCSVRASSTVYAMTVEKQEKTT